MTKSGSDHSAYQREGRHRSKATYDLPLTLCQRVQNIAGRLGCSQSDVVAHLLAAGLKSYTNGQLDLISSRRPAQFRLRFSHKLLPPELPGASDDDKWNVDRPYPAEKNERNNRHPAARPLNSLPTPASHFGLDISPANIGAVPPEGSPPKPDFYKP